MTELIKIEPANIGGETIQTCNARELHASLGVGRDFSNWIKGRIEKYGFTENVDYVKISRENTLAKFGDRDNTGKTGDGAIDYFLSLGMAKELAMVENNEQGRKIRRYFIDCERIAKSKTAGTSSTPHITGAGLFYFYQRLLAEGLIDRNPNLELAA